MTSSGKVRRRACRELFQSGEIESLRWRAAGRKREQGQRAAETATAAPTGAASSPATPLDTLREIIAEVSGHPVAEVDASLRMSAQPVNSLKLIQIQLLLESRLGLRLTVESMLAASSLAALARGNRSFPAASGGRAPTLLTNISDAVGRIAAALPIVSRGSESLGRIDLLIDSADDMTDPPDARPLRAITRDIRFDRVTFAYPGGEPMLREVSFTVQAGSAVALVGASGSGKSTALSLLTRLYQPVSGSILIDDALLQNATEDSLRAVITAVPQTPTLFRGTIRDNIAIANPAASDAEIAAAAEAAGLAETIAGLAEGYATQVGDGGNRLSGGQRQRVAIARAFLRGAPIILFDEATSALDSGSEAIVNRSIAALRGRHTVLTVTHRTTGLGDFDDILVFDRGRLVERGRHADLVALGGVYYQLWARVEGVGQEHEGVGPIITADRLARFDFFSDCSREFHRFDGGAVPAGTDARASRGDAPGRSRGQVLHPGARVGGSAARAAGSPAGAPGGAESRRFLRRDGAGRRCAAHRHGPNPDGLPVPDPAPGPFHRLAGARAAGAGKS